MKGLSRKLRQKVYARDGFHCAYCGKILSSMEIQYDHITPRSKGGKNNYENLHVCCPLCNSRKGTKTLEEFRSFMERKNAGLPYFNAIQLRWLERNNCLKHINILPLTFYFEMCKEE